MTYPAKPFYEVSSVNPNEVEEDFAAHVLPEDHALIEERRKIFDQITAEFSCDLGKVIKV